MLVTGVPGSGGVDRGGLRPFVIPGAGSRIRWQILTENTLSMEADLRWNHSTE